MKDNILHHSIKDTIEFFILLFAIKGLYEHSITTSILNNIIGIIITISIMFTIMTMIIFSMRIQTDKHFKQDLSQNFIILFIKYIFTKSIIYNLIMYIVCFNVLKMMIQANLYQGHIILIMMVFITCLSFIFQHIKLNIRDIIKINQITNI